MTTIVRKRDGAELMKRNNICVINYNCTDIIINTSLLYYSTYVRKIHNNRRTKMMGFEKIIKTSVVQLKVAAGVKM